MSLAIDLRLDPQRFIGEIGGEAVSLFRLRHANGMEVAVCNLGAKVLQILVPDRDGTLSDVVLGYDSLTALQVGAPSMGAFIGRYAGRIAQAHFTLDGVDHSLYANAGSHCIHGGPRGTRHRVFKARQTSGHTLELHHRFLPEDDGFPGVLDLHLRYHLSDHNELVIEHEAIAIEGSSPASFACHVFFNLDGPGLTTVDDHQLQVLANHLLATDTDNVATGARSALDGHALDLRAPRRLGDLPDIDHSYEIEVGDRSGALRLCACASSTVIGRTLEVWSTEPVLQVYTAGALGTGATPDIGKLGVRHLPRAGLCLEPQQYPNAPNCSSFPLNRVTPRWPYRAQTRYRFGVLG